ncbi:hypothetical protein ACQP00_17775 [Dactylosporangium sp. CS-047395]|uniref:hypothetical protein n=1 Tax=Dactylosporangium sp. CS-047395 TaxID=3239936 RepID=UPI003D931B13
MTPAHCAAGPSASRICCVSSSVWGSSPPIIRPTGVRRNSRQSAIRAPSGSRASPECVLIPPVVMAMLRGMSPSAAACRASSSHSPGFIPSTPTAAS